MYSDEYIEDYLNKQLKIMDDVFLRKSSIYKFAMWRYSKCCVFSINRKMYNDTKNYMRKMRMKEIIYNITKNNFVEIPTASYMKF